MTREEDWSDGRGGWEKRKWWGSVQINDRVLKTLLVNKIGLYVVFQELFIPLQHQVL